MRRLVTPSEAVHDAGAAIDLAERIASNASPIAVPSAKVAIDLREGITAFSGKHLARKRPPVFKGE